MARKKKAIKPGSKEFVELQNKWYDKLRKSGFNDIEFYDPKTGVGRGSPFLMDASHNMHKKYNKDTENHYRLCRNYLAHFPKKYPSHYKVLWEMYSEGVTYREMLSKLGRRFCKSRTIHLRSLNAIFTSLIKDCYEWNKKNKEGMLNQAIEDLYLDEVLIQDIEYDGKAEN